MAVENGPSGSSPELEWTARDPQFNFENMPLDAVRSLHRILFEVNEAAFECEDSSTRLDDIEKVTNPFYTDLGNLPYRNIERARELILPLARSEHEADRYAAAAGPLARLLRRECEIGTEDVTEQVEMMAHFVGEASYHTPTHEISQIVVHDALKEVWWPEPIARRIDEAWWVP